MVCNSDTIERIVISDKGYLSTEVVKLLTDHNINIVLMDTYGNPPILTCSGFKMQKDRSTFSRGTGKPHSCRIHPPPFKRAQNSIT